MEGERERREKERMGGKREVGGKGDRREREEGRERME